MEARGKEILQGTVIRVTDYGAFVKLSDGRSGLLHISEIASAYVKSVRDYLAEGDSVKVQVLGIDDKGRLDLSAKKAGIINPKAFASQSVRPPEPETQPMHHTISFEEKLRRYMKQSEERLLDIKRNTEGKRGGTHHR